MFTNIYQLIPYLIIVSTHVYEWLQEGLSGFIQEPMGKKLVTEVPGIDYVVGGKLKSLGITTARLLFMYYLQASKENFMFLIFQCGGSYGSQQEAYTAMMLWEAVHLANLRHAPVSDISVQTQKMKNFIDNFKNLMGHQVKDVPGIGPAIMSRLQGNNIWTVQNLYQYYKKLSEWEFKYLIGQCGGNRLHQSQAYKAMQWGEGMKTQTMRDFIYNCDRMMELPVTSVPGIGDAIGRNLCSQSIQSVRDLYERYKVMSESKFKELIGECGGYKPHQRDAYNAMRLGGYVTTQKMKNLIGSCSLKNPVQNVPGIKSSSLLWISQPLLWIRPTLFWIGSVGDLYECYKTLPEYEFKGLIGQCGGDTKDAYDAMQWVDCMRTQTAKDFVQTWSMQASVCTVPGIGNAIGQKLCDRNIWTVEDLYQHYNTLSEFNFKHCIGKCGGNRLYQEDIYNAMQWVDMECLRQEMERLRQQN